MTLGSKIDDDIKLVLRKEAIDECAVTDIASMEEATVIVDILGDGAEVAGIGQ